MATINHLGNISARCSGICEGTTSMFLWRDSTAAIGAVKSTFGSEEVNWRLYRCSGCGSGALAILRFSAHEEFLAAARNGSVSLMAFQPESHERKELPKETPAPIKKEFREAEDALSANCNRAAAGLARSVLDKTLRANGYKFKKGTNLEQQIDAAATDGVITPTRQRRAHEEIRVLGNDVLHEAWQEVPYQDVDAALHYAQRILEDFYDDRETVLAALRSKGRTPHEDDPSLLLKVIEE